MFFFYGTINGIVKKAWVSTIQRYVNAIKRLISAFVVLVQGKRYNTNTLAQSRVCFVDKFEVANFNSYELKKNICFFFS